MIARRKRCVRSVICRESHNILNRVGGRDREGAQLKGFGRVEGKGAPWFRVQGRTFIYFTYCQAMVTVPMLGIAICPEIRQT